VADGEGRNSVWCAQQGLVVDAFDLSPVAVAKAQKLAAERGVHVNYYVSDIDEWTWTPETYDVVVVIFVQFATPEMCARLFANCIRALKPGGLVILQGYTPRQLEFKTGGPSILEHLYTEPMLREAFSSVDMVECRFYEAEISEGTHHSGMSALAGMVGRRRI
jgi:2-polyprenyl-3-methyl-5-hydroxy-6-metoxy-1,4-benzoquinol methylase